jgi:uncharacterized membrane protein SpoIIM required for sporulation
MLNQILDDSSNYWQTIITSDTIISVIIVLIGLFFIYDSIGGWYYFHYPRGFVFMYEPEITWPIRLMASILICFYGVRLFLGKMKARTAIVLSIFTLGGTNMMIMIFL